MNFKVFKWGHEYTITEIDKIEPTLKDYYLKCSCGNEYCCINGEHPMNKWDDEKNKEITKHNHILYYGSEKNFEEDNKTCECGVKFKDMKLLYPINKPSLFPSVKFNGSEPELNHRCLSDESYNKKWYDMDGGIEEYRDKFNGEMPPTPTSI